MNSLTNKTLIEHINTIVINNNLPTLNFKNNVTNLLHIHNNINIVPILNTHTIKTHQIAISLFLLLYSNDDKMNEVNIFVIDHENDIIQCYSYNPLQTCNLFILFCNNKYFHIITKIYFKDKIYIKDNIIYHTVNYTHYIDNNNIPTPILDNMDINNFNVCTKLYLVTSNTETFDDSKCILCKQDTSTEMPLFIHNNQTAKNVTHVYKTPLNEYYVPVIFFKSNTDNIIPTQSHIDIINNLDTNNDNHVKFLKVINYCVNKINNNKPYRQLINLKYISYTKDDIKNILTKKNIPYSNKDDKGALLEKLSIQ